MNNMNITKEQWIIGLLTGALAYTVIQLRKHKLWERECTGFIDGLRAAYDSKIEKENTNE